MYAPTVHLGNTAAATSRKQTSPFFAKERVPSRYLCIPEERLLSTGNARDLVAAAYLPCAVLASFVAEHSIHGPLVHHEVERFGGERELTGVENLRNTGEGNTDRHQRHVQLSVWTSEP